MAGLHIVKGHGTENDFVLVPDVDARLDLTPALVRALCDRRAGIGGDGVIRVARTAALVDAGQLPAALGGAGAPEWFMDYRNADGSLAEMCGNGTRVFTAYLLREGMAGLDDAGGLLIGTRTGPRRMRRDGDLLAVDLGPWHVGDADQDVTVSLPGEPVPLPGLTVDVGNPHVVVALPGRDDLAAVNLAVAPVLHPTPEAGANVEVVVPLPARGGPAHGSAPSEGHLLMRVHERGVGETRSCGTGAAAAAIAARAWGGALAPAVWWVDVPGGRLRVTLPSGADAAGDAVELAGPAIIVGEATLDKDWVAAATAAGS